jgi:alpha-tubulin suppressor-like RCC1 family protein
MSLVISPFTRTLKDNIYILNSTPLSITSNLQIPPSKYFIIPKDFILDISNNAVIDNSGEIVNYGTINIEAGSAINNFPGSVFLNEFNSIINNDSSSNSNINSGRFINRGEYNNELDESIFTNNLGGVFINKNGGTFSNTGTLVNLPGGIFENYYNYLTNINYGEVINYGQYIPDIKGLVYPQYHIISDGSAHSLAINTIQGDLYAWGANNSGQIGNSLTGANILVPSKVPSTELSGNIWTTIAGGGNTSFGIRDDYSLYSWGDNTSGHLGLGINDTIRNYPTIIPPSANWIGVASGLNHALALDYNNFLYSWGNNTYGQLGISSNDNKNSPNLTHNTISTTITITDTSNIIIPANINYINIGIVGQNTLGAYGAYGAYAQVFNFPVLPGDKISFSIYTLLGGSGAPYGGAGSYVYINDNSAANVGLIAVAGGAGGYSYDGDTTINGGNAGTTQSKGKGFDGSYNNPGFQGGGGNSNGTGNGGTSYYPTGIGSSYNEGGKGGDSVFVQPEGGGGGGGYGGGGGGNFDGFTGGGGGGGGGGSYAFPAGNGTTSSINTNTLAKSSYITYLSSFTPQVSDFACGANHTLAIHLADGSLHSCGKNDSGQLGTGNLSYSYSNYFRDVSMSSVTTGTKWIKVAAGYQHSMGLRDDGSLYAWGDNSNGQLGNGGSVSYSTPQQVLLSSIYGIVTGKKWTQIACGYYHSIGLRDDGTLYAWGLNANGQLGHANNANVNAPELVYDGQYSNNYISCSAGAYHTMGVRNDGKVYTWGLNANGQLGINSITNHNAPQLITDISLNPIINI